MKSRPSACIVHCTATETVQGSSQKLLRDGGGGGGLIILGIIVGPLYLDERAK